VLDYRLGDRNIAEVLDMPVEEALGFFGPGDPAARGGAPKTLEAKAHRPAADAILQRMADVGLGYLRSASRSPRCRVASGSGSSSRRTWVKRAESTCSMNRVSEPRLRLCCPRADSCVRSRT
jgi:hypothetical protein